MTLRSLVSLLVLGLLGRRLGKLQERGKLGRLTAPGVCLLPAGVLLLVDVLLVGG